MAKSEVIIETIRGYSKGKVFSFLWRFQNSAQSGAQSPHQSQDQNDLTYLFLYIDIKEVNKLFTRKPLICDTIL